MLVKACVPRYFWLTSFVVANVLIDVEVLVYLLRDDPPLHRHLHTYVGGTGIGILAGLLMFGAACVIRRLRPGSRFFASDFGALSKSRLLFQSLIAGLIGGVSHIFLDSLMHRDMRPWWPFAYKNQLIELVSVSSLHIGCALAGLFGLVLWLLLRETEGGA